MLKKIVKYGNSNALVLDKALLELLNIPEGSIVKIKTDGVSLIITPQNTLISETILPTLTVEDTVNSAVMKSLEESLGDPEKARAFQEELMELSDRYAKIIQQKKNTPEWHQAIATIQKRFAGDEANPEYAKAITAVNNQIAPELNLMNQESEALIKKYHTNSHDWSAANINLLSADFRKVHEENKFLLVAVAALKENPEYLQEMLLLAEKYQAIKDSKEYFEEYTRIISKYIPEYATYAAELKKIGQPFNKPAKKIKAQVKKKRS